VTRIFALTSTVVALASIDCATATSIVVDVWSEVPCDKRAIVLVMVGGSLMELPMKAPASQSTRCTPNGTMVEMGTIVLVPRRSTDETIAFAAMTRGDDRSPEACLQVPDGCIVAKREITFVPRTQVRMRVDLRVACLGIRCDDVQTTCVVGTCVPARVNNCSKTCGESLLSLSAGLVAYWKLDGDAKDASGHGLDLVGAPLDASHVLQFSPGKIGQGLFPGMPPGDSLGTGATALQHAPAPLLDFANDFTVSLWAKHQKNPDVDQLWWGYGILDNDQVWLSAQGDGVSPTPANTVFALRAGGMELARVTDTAFDFRSAPNVWKHIVVFRRGGTMGLRVDGRETTASFSGTVGAASTFYLARRTDGYPWQGMIDEVGKWNRALLASEMDDLYAGGMGRTLP
jgi:hypothetical protein